MTEWANFRQVSHPKLGLFSSSQSERRVFSVEDEMRTNQISFRELTIEVHVLWPSRKTPTNQDLTSGRARFTMDGAEGEARVPRLITRRGRLSVSQPSSGFAHSPFSLVPYLSTGLASDSS